MKHVNSYCIDIFDYEGHNPWHTQYVAYQAGGDKGGRGIGKML